MVIVHFDPHEAVALMALVDLALAKSIELEDPTVKNDLQSARDHIWEALKELVPDAEDPAG